jgi:hypothetical protein
MGDATEATGRVAERARREADAYRGENPRPLERYVIVLGIYGVLVALAAVVAAVTGRNLPVRPLQDLITVTIGTHKLSRTLTKDAVTSRYGRRSPTTRAPARSSRGDGGNPARQRVAHSTGSL